MHDLNSKTTSAAEAHGCRSPEGPARGVGRLQLPAGLVAHGLAAHRAHVAAAHPHLARPGIARALNCGVQVPTDAGVKSRQK